MQSQSATGHLSDEQQSAPQAQSQHPEFPQLQPITKSATQANSNFFITKRLFKFPIISM